MDHIPLVMKKVVDSPYPSDREVLERIIAKVSAMKNGGKGGPAPAGKSRG